MLCKSRLLNTQLCNDIVTKHRVENKAFKIISSRTDILMLVSIQKMAIQMCTGCRRTVLAMVVSINWAACIKLHYCVCDGQPETRKANAQLTGIQSWKKTSFIISFKLCCGLENGPWSLKLVWTWKTWQKWYSLQSSPIRGNWCCHESRLIDNINGSRAEGSPIM